MGEEKVQLRPLLELVEKAFFRTNTLPKGCDSVADLLRDAKKCVDFMNEQLGTDVFELHEEDKNFYEVAQCRARHSVITYLLGLVLKSFGKTIGFDVEEKRPLWLKLSMYHDYGYFSKHVEDSTYDLRTDAKYYLLNDVYENELQILNGWFTEPSEDLAFAYKEIEGYFEYSRKFHKKHNEKDDKEYVDHGVLGGVLIFHRLVSKLLKYDRLNETELRNIKTFCLTIAQHNMFRIRGDDKNLANGLGLEKLYEENPFRINKETPLLLFLSLIDTVECVKKFSKKLNPKKYFEADTTLRKLKLYVDSSKIILDFSELRESAKSDGKEKTDWFHETFDGDTKGSGYVGSICAFDTWTIFRGNQEGQDILTITLP